MSAHHPPGSALKEPWLINANEIAHKQSIPIFIEVVYYHLTHDYINIHKPGPTIGYSWGRDYH